MISGYMQQPFSLPFSALFPLAIHPVALWVIFGVALLGALIMTAVFFYHWRKYAVGSALVLSADAVHLVVLGILFSMAFIGVAEYSL